MTDRKAFSVDRHWYDAFHTPLRLKREASPHELRKRSGVPHTFALLQPPLVD